MTNQDYLQPYYEVNQVIVKTVLEKKHGSFLSTLPKQDIKEWHEIFFEKTKTRNDLIQLQAYIENSPTAHDESPHELFHSFADGMYTREMHIKAGELIVGAIHRNEYFINVLKGRVWVVSEFYSKELIAPCSFKAPAGTKHIGLILEDTVWIDTHKVSTEVIEEAEKEIFAESYEDLDRLNGVINSEYSQMCRDINIAESAVKSASEITTDIISLDKKYVKNVEVRESFIEGMGVFVNKDFIKGDVIGDARVDDKRTILGRYTNHDDNPNTEGVIKDNKAIIIALLDIKNGEEITMDYRQSRKLAKLLDGEQL